MSYQPFGDEPRLKRRRPLPRHPRTECPLCLRPAEIVGEIRDSTDQADALLVCCDCGFIGEVLVARAASGT